MNNDNGLGCLGTGIAFILALCFMGGNIALISGDVDDFEFAVVVAIIADSAIAMWLLTVFKNAVGRSYEKRHKKNLTERKEIVVKEIGNKILHRNEIQQSFGRHFEKIERESSLISLISSCMGNTTQELNRLLYNNQEEAFTSLKNEIWCKLSESEKKRFPESLDEVENYEKTLAQEISELKTDLTSVATCNEEKLSTMIKKYCPEIYKSINRKRAKLIAKIVTLIILIIILVCSFYFIKNTPYRELHSLIEEQSITATMLSWDGPYYDYIHSEKGYNFLASELTRLHRDNDIKKAIRLLCVQPDCIDGIRVCASDSFIDWVVDYARENSSYITNSNGDTTYFVDNYEITISSVFDSSVDHSFSVSDGQVGSNVNSKNPFHEGNVPTIQ